MVPRVKVRRGLRPLDLDLVHCATKIVRGLKNRRIEPRIVLQQNHFLPTGVAAEAGCDCSPETFPGELCRMPVKEAMGLLRIRNGPR